jgi:hypothetical protein
MTQPWPLKRGCTGVASLHNTNLIGPGFSTVLRPNNDTLYSAAWLNLRAEPVVLTLPEIQERY